MKHLLSLIILLCCLSSQVFAMNCNKSKNDYEHGLAAGINQQWQEAKNALINSVAECNTFNNWYLLGQVYQHLDEHDNALSALEDSQQYAKNKNERALSMARYAQSQAAQGEIVRPLNLIHIARKTHSNPPDWMTILARKLDTKRLEKPLSTALITRALTNRSIALFNRKEKPSLNVNINFKDNSIAIVKGSYGALDILASALNAEELTNHKITIIGHSDKRGTDKYNDKLSKRRAEFIKQELISRNPSLKNRLNTKGVGERFPLYVGDTEQVYQFNRRIELKVN